jgi:hypothetical protein
LKLFSLWKPPSCEGKFCGGVGGICQPWRIVLWFIKDQCEEGTLHSHVILRLC